MQLVTDFTGNYDQDPVRFLGFEQHLRQEAPHPTLHIGYGALKHENDEPAQHLYLSLEEPNNFMHWETHPEKFQHQFAKIFTLCPYTAQWLNAELTEPRWVPVFFPVDESLVPPARNKTLDVIYVGNMQHPIIENIVRAIQPFRHCVVCFGQLPGVTHANVGYLDKLELVASARVAVVHNLLWLVPWHFDALRARPGIENHQAFRSALAQGSEPPLVPQIKSRVFESALCQTLMLCRRDEWNLIERFFEPNREFLYYTDETELHDRILDVIHHYNDYADIVYRAYVRAQREYTSAAFYRKYLQPWDVA